MKIIQINAVYEYSSTGRTTMEMHNYLRELGHNSYVFCVNEDRSSENIYKFSNRFDMKIHSFLSHVFGKQGHYSYFSTKRMLREIERIAPDIVHLRVLHSNCINLKLLLSYLADNDIPTVITLHDCWYFTGHCCYFVDANCNKWKNHCGECPEIKNWNASYFFDNSSKMILEKEELFGKVPRLAVIGVSDWVTDFVQYSILKKARIIKRIYNWIDISKYSDFDNIAVRKKFRLKEDDFVVLGVAQRWTPTKGLYDIIEVAKKCVDIKFVVVGDVMGHQLPENVVPVGVLSNERDLLSCYAMADVFFNPSKRETFGKVTIEALASGTPAVVYNAAASPELITEGCGYVVEKGDVDGAVEKILQIKKEGKESYSSICRDFARNNFNIAHLVSENIKVYHQLMNF